MKKLLGLFIVFIIVIGVAGYTYIKYQQQQEVKSIVSFMDCVKAGYPVMESYPAQCKTPDGRLFREDIGNELEYINEIIVESPRPNSYISSPLLVTGRAKGNWYFEGSFSGELFDSNNTSLGVVILQAQGDWMTEDFVQFQGTLDFESPGMGEGKLIIKNANPSDLPENSKELRIPLRFTN